jgi:hypothetical protein
MMDLGGAEFGVVDGSAVQQQRRKSDVVVIDTRTLTIKARWPVAPAEQPPRWPWT